ncbi:MAG: hypothetical protein U9O96_04090 [Candidatus Thermoplasmatota archaeon]|nr:hypothetical protein [Candidatus Thermoplasmatota archaeon]
MKNINIYAVRARLPHGSLAQIAETLNLSRNTVSNFFNKGWYPYLSEDILTEAISILKGSRVSDDLISEADNLGLTGGGGFRPRRKYGQKDKKGTGFDLFSLAAIGALAYFAIPEVKKFIDENVGSLFGKGKSSREARIDEIMKEEGR